MIEKRIEKKASRTAAMTCMSRAASHLEKDPGYHSDDYLAVRILPKFIGMLIHISLFRRLLVQRLAPLGVYEYVIARTKYIDAVFKEALTDRFDQILIFGAGYDTRALRFHDNAEHTRIFELDEPHTQQAKIKQLRKRHIHVPSNLVFIAVDFEKETLSRKLEKSGFRKGRKNLFILEGLLMYLEAESVRETFQVIREYGTKGSRVAFDYIRASVLRHENTLYGESELVKSVRKAGEPWQFALEPGEIRSFTTEQGFKVIDHKCARDLEKTYFQDPNGRIVGRVNGTHCIVTMERE